MIHAGQAGRASVIAVPSVDGRLRGEPNGPFLTTRIFRSGSPRRRKCSASAYRDHPIANPHQNRTLLKLVVNGRYQPKPVCKARRRGEHGPGHHVCVNNIRAHLLNNRAQPQKCLDQSDRLTPLLVQVEMRYPVLRYQIDIGTACAGERHIVSSGCLQAGKINGHVHDAVADFVAMICEVKNTNGASPDFSHG
jgi:hypothetical protein